MTKQPLIKSIFWLTISEIIFNISGYIIHSGVGRILGPEDYGRYGLVVTLTTMIIILIGNGIPTAMSKYLSEIFETEPNMIGVIKKKAFQLQAILIGGITILFFILTPLPSKMLGDDSLTPLFQISTLIIPAFALASFYFYYFTGIHRFNLQAILKTVRSIAKIIFILGLAWFFKVEGAIAGYIVAPLLVFIIAVIIDFLAKPTSQKNTDTAKFSTKKLLNYAWPLTLFLLFYEIMISIDLYMVKALLQNDFLTGIYNGALTVGRIPYYLFYALTIVLLPKISQTTSLKLKKETAKIVAQTIRLLTILLPLAIILMVVFAQDIIALFYGTDYLSADKPMQILVVGVGFLTVFYVLSFALNGAGKVKTTMTIAGTGMAANIVLNYFLIQSSGLTGAAVATTTTSFFVMLAILYIVKKEFNVSLPLKSLFRVILASGVTYFASTLFSGNSYLFIFWSLLLSIIYFIILYVLKEFQEEDFNLFKKLIKK